MVPESWDESCSLGMDILQSLILFTLANVSLCVNHHLLKMKVLIRVARCIVLMSIMIGPRCIVQKTSSKYGV